MAVLDETGDGGPPTPTPISGRAETGRVEAFSDGVFAIAITLLVLDLKVPGSDSQGVSNGLLAALLIQWPVYAAYVVSFLTVLVMWLNHHSLFQHIGRVDHTLLWLNGLLLMGVAVVPFPTAVLAEYLRGSDARIAAAFYAGTFFGIALVFNLLWRHASADGRLLDERADRAAVQAISDDYRYGPLFYAVALALAFVSAPLSVTVCGLLAVFFAIPRGATRRGPKKA